MSALDEAIAREEYEWAAELFYRVKRETVINKL
jgi:predicted metal-dependent HD superfamily phosphohydrolase